MQSIHVDRGVSGDYHIQWDERFTEQAVNIYAGTSAAQIDMAQPVVEHANAEATIPGLACGLRHYFFLQPTSDDGVNVGQRNIPLQGAVNFRDLGGYRTRDGRRVSWGRIFRSGHLSNLTREDTNDVASLDIRAVCDLRVADEVANEKTALPNDPDIEILEIPPGIKDRFYFHRVFETAKTPEDIVRAMHDVMRSFVLDTGPRFLRVFEVLLEAPQSSVLINCSAGKERTGVGSALVLMALGVPRETILYDFMLSKTYFPAASELGRVYEKYAVSKTGEPARRLVMPLLETRESYLQSAFDAIDEHYASDEAFLGQTYGLGAHELKRLRDTYTEPSVLSREKLS